MKSAVPGVAPALSALFVAARQCAECSDELLVVFALTATTAAYGQKSRYGPKTPQHTQEKTRKEELTRRNQI
jgi:hypothetical protein